MKLVSILIPCYNKAEHLQQCIESALSQNYAAKRIMLFDDGSTDESLTIAKKYPIEVFSRPNNQGKVATLLDLYRLCTDSYWIQLLDADDYLLPNKITDQLNQEDANLYIDGYKLLYVSGKELHHFLQNDVQQIIRSLAFGVGTQGNSMLTKRSLLEKLLVTNGAIWRDLPWLDYWLLLDCIRVGAKIISSDRISSVYRVGWSDKQMTAQNPLERMQVLQDLRKESVRVGKDLGMNPITLPMSSSIH